VAGALNRRGVVNLKCLYHLGGFVVDGTMIVPTEEHLRSVGH
jgi:hypothetical protein